MKANCRLHRILIGRERSAFDEQFEPLCRRTIERHHHQMQIYREGIHGYDFPRFRPDEHGSLVSKKAVVRHPWMSSMEVSLHAQFCPISQLLIDERFHRFRLESQGMPAQIHAFFPGAGLWKKEALAKTGEGVGLVHLRRVLCSGLIVRRVQDSSMGASWVLTK